MLTEEEAETVVATGTGLETGGKPLPSLVSVIESASTSEHELFDSKFSMSSCLPSPPRSSSFSVPPSSSSSQVQMHICADMPPHSVSVAPIYCDRSGGGSGELRLLPPRSLSATSAAPRSVSPPPKLMTQSSILPNSQIPPSNAAVYFNSAPASSVELDVTHGRDANKISSSSSKETLEVGPHLALRHDDDVHVYMGGGGIVVDDDDDDVDQFMDQFMEHYNLDREEDQRDDANRPDQGGPDNDVGVTLGKVDKRAVVDEDGDEMQLPLRPWSSTSPATAPAVSLVDAASVSSSETMSTSATLTTFPRTSSPILASDDSSLFDSYSYTYPYPSSRQNGEMGLELKSPYVSIPSVSDSTPPASATWSTSESASVSRSRSFSSTYTTLSGEESETTSSCPQSSVDGDDEVHTDRYSSGIQHPSPSQPPMLVKSPTDSVLHAEVSVLGSPPALSMPFSGNEDIGYIVSVPVPGLISKRPVHRDGPLSSTTERDDDTNSTATATYLAGHDDSDVRVEDRAGEEAGEQHASFSKFWMDGGVVMGKSERQDVEDEVLSQKREEGIMRKKHDLATEVKTTVKATEVKENVEAEVEWDYIVGDRPFAASNGKLNVALNGRGREGDRHAIAIVTPDAVSSDEPFNEDTKLTTTSRYSPPLLSATSSAMPAMTLSTSPVFLKDDLTCGSSTAVAAALAMSSWKQDTSEMVGGSSSYSSTHKSDRSISHAIIVNDDHVEKRRMRTGALERAGRRDHQASFLAISSGSSSSSSNEGDDDRYGPVYSSSPSQSQAAVNVDLRTQLSRTTSSSISATPPRYASPPSKRSPPVSDNIGSRFSENEDEDDDDDDQEDDDDEDDDIPLAKRIPGALSAQKSIRHQVRQEREKKKQEKVLRGQAEEATRTRLMTLRPAGAVPSSPHDTAALVASQTTTHRNSRTLTRKGSKSFSPEDLARKLRDINGPNGVEAATTTSSVDTALYLQQALHSLHRSRSMTRSLRDVRPPSTTETLPPVPIPQSRPPSSNTQRAKSVKEPSPSPYHYHTSPSPTPINSTYAPSSMTPLRPMRSFHFHRPSIDRRPIGMDDPRSVPLPIDAEKRISRNSTLVTRSRPSTRDGSSQQTSIFHHRSLSRSRSSVERTSTTAIPEPVPPIPTARISHGEHYQLFKFHHCDSSSSRAGPNRISADADKHSRAPSRQHRPVPPPVPASSSSSPPDSLPVISSKPELVVQQRVFIGNMQRFNMVEIGASTTAGDVIEMIEAEGSLKDFAGSGGWMVFEIAQDFGMGTFFFFLPYFIATSSVCFNLPLFFFFLSRTPHKEL